ncbi:hypothetical protein D3C79_859160 [compost metagenome]
MLFEVGRVIVATPRGYGLLAEVKQCLCANLRSQQLRLLQGALQACLRQIGSGSIGLNTFEPDGQHYAFVTVEKRRLGDALTH